MAHHYVYRFYAELNEYKPKIWRRFEINGEKTMAELGYALMLMFEMQASHQFCFRENNRDAFLADMRARYSEEELNSVLGKHGMVDLMKNSHYELASEDMYLGDNERFFEADKIKLNRITDRPGWHLTFEYDYGDGWEVDLTLEQCEKQEVSLSGLPSVLEGEGFGIIEDIGGVGGLEELAKTLKKGKGRKYKEFCDWLDTTMLDLSAFNIEDMNFRLKKLIRFYKEIYEYHYQPTDKSIALLNREYKGKGVLGY